MQGRGFSIVAGGRRYPGPWITNGATRDPATGLWTFVPVEGGEVGTDINLDNIGLWSDVVGVTFSGGEAHFTDNLHRMRTETILSLYQWYAAIINTTTKTSRFKLFNTVSSTYFEPSAVGEHRGTFRCDTVDGYAGFYQLEAAPKLADLTSYSIKPLTFSSLIALRNMGRSTLASYGAPCVIPTGYHNGVVGWATPDYLNGIYARHNRINVVLEKTVNGTPTVLVNAAAAYSDNLMPTIVRVNATTFQVWYNGVQVGADQSISDAGIINNTYFGLFNTGAGTVGDPVYAYA